MKNFGTRLTTLLLVCILAIMPCTMALADGERVNVGGKYWNAFWRYSGNGKEVSIFQAAVRSAPATIYFYQDEGLCYEDSYTHYFDGRAGKEEEWGKYHIYYKINGCTRHVDWDKTRNGGSFELYLNETGTYIIWVVPFTAQEMTDSWTLDTFISWNKAPSWWIGYSSGMDISSAQYQIDMYGNFNYNGKKLSAKDIIR